MAAERIGDTVYNWYDRNTGVPFNGTVYDVLPDGVVIDDGVWFANPSRLGGGFLKRNYEGPVNLKWYAKGDGVTDDNNAIIAALQFVKTEISATLYIPKGIYLYTDLGNLILPNITIEGQGSSETILQFQGSGIALSFNAFASGSDSDPFMQNFNLKNICVSGNANTTVVIYAQGIARSKWENVYVKEANPSSGIGFDFAGVQLSTFTNVACSDLLTPMTSVVYEGLRLRAGSRAGVSIGNSSNNTFYQPYFEHLSIGARFAEADQNYFIGGSPEGCSIYGLLVGANSRFNTFIGTGFENIGAVDVSDSGIYTRYINCYFSNLFRFGSTSRGVSLEGCYGERFEVQASAMNASMIDITYNNWSSGSGGVFDSGTNTYKRNLYNADTSTYDKNSEILSGTQGAESFRIKTLTDGNEKLNTTDGIGAFTGFLNSTTTNFPAPGCGLAVDRVADLTQSSAIGSFRLQTSVDAVRILRFKKMTSAGVWSSWDDILTRSTHVLAGTTANRPIAGTVQLGEYYFDATLGKPIWWNGTVWKDATGSTV